MKHTLFQSRSRISPATEEKTRASRPEGPERLSLIPGIALAKQEKNAPRDMKRISMDTRR